MSEIYVKIDESTEAGMKILEIVRENNLAVYDTPLAAFAEEEAPFRLENVNEDWDDGMPEEKANEIVALTAHKIYNYLVGNEEAMNYDGLDSIVEEVLKE